MSLLISFPEAEPSPVSGDLKMHVTFRGCNCRARGFSRIRVDMDLSSLG
jgi:hypothetical protein